MSEPEPFPASRCRGCGKLFGHSPTVCRCCGGETIDPAEIPGDGRLYASTVIRVPAADNEGEEPYRVGLVDVGGDDTVRVTARIECEGDHTPETPLEYIGRRSGAFVFRPV